MEVRVVAASAVSSSPSLGIASVVAGQPLDRSPVTAATLRLLAPHNVGKGPDSSPDGGPPLPPICTTANHSHGMWVRVTKAECSSGAGSPFCRGDPSWLSDAAGFNTGLVWVPLAFGASAKAVASEPSSSLSTIGNSNGGGGDGIALSDDEGQRLLLATLPQNPPPYLTSYASSSVAAAAEGPSEGTTAAPYIPCRYHIHSPPGGPPRSCLRVRESNNKSPYTRGGSKHGATLTIVGDSVMREYGKNCGLYSLRGARLVCVFNNIVLEGQHYSRDYAKAVALNILQAATRNKAAFFATNLGIHHMVGPSTTAQWIEFVDIFAEMWRKAAGERRQSPTDKPSSPAAEAEGSSPPPEFHLAYPEELAAGEVLDPSSLAFSPSSSASLEGSAPAPPPTNEKFFVMEKAIWIGPPAVHYARRGMCLQRAALWDQLAWERLAPLGFERLNAVAPTLARQEGTWDGLHYAAERGKVQTPLRDRGAAVRQWNGGVAAMLFTMLLNMVCG